MTLTAEQVRELFDCSADGVLTWRVKPAAGVAAGAVAGSVDATGYRRVLVRGRRYMAHRLVWAHVHGRWPESEVDHIDGARANNRPSNLRDVSSTVNHQNLRRACSTSQSGLLGAHREGRRYAARIRTPHGRVRLGQFASAEEAHAAYVAAKRRLHEGNTL